MAPKEPDNTQATPAPAPDASLAEPADAVVVRKRRAPESAAPDKAPASAEAAASVEEVSQPEAAEQTAAPPTEPPAAAADPPGPPSEVKKMQMAAAPREPDDRGLGGLDDSRPDFGALLDATSAAPAEDIEQGMMVRGALVALSGEWAFVDLGAKTEGILAAEELMDDSGALTVGIGDQIEAFVVSVRGGEIRLSRSLGQRIRDYESVLDARETGGPVEGRVVATNKGGYEVRVAGRRAFCPISQIDLGYTEDPEVHLHQTYQFRVMEASPDGKRIVLSRAALLREEREERREALRAELAEGVLLEGVVRSIQDYGAFVDIGGLEGLAHVSELSWRRVEHPSEVLSEGDTVQVKVLSIKPGKKGDRISLSVREAQPHPWVAVGTKFVEGESYEGTVTRLEQFGAFVELGPGIEGLIHVSEMSWERRINHANEILSVGEKVTVYVKEIDEERQRIALSLKALIKDPWSDVGKRFPVGSSVSGVIEKIQPFGLFVEIEPGLVALIPASESGTGSGADLRREFQPGQAVQATVISVEPRRKRMSLSLKAAEEAEDAKALQDFYKTQKSAAKGGSFGTLGDLFGDKLKKKK